MSKETKTLGKNFDWNLEKHEEFPVVESFRKPERKQLEELEVNDESLRDGAQGTRRLPNFVEMTKYIGLAGEVGIRAATVGIYSGEASQGNQNTLHLLKYMQEKSNIVPIVLARPLEPDLKFVEECSVRNRSTEVVVFQGASPLRLYIQNWDEGEVLRNLSSAAERLVKKGVEVTVFTEDSSRTPPEFLAKLVRVVKESGASRIGIADTVGNLDPFGAFRLIGAVKSMLVESGIPQVSIDFHGHRDRGLDIANVISAIAAGAQRIHGALGGVGERSGNVPLEVVLYNVNRMLTESGGKEKWNLQRLFQWVEYYFKISDMSMPDHAPLIGQKSFTTSAGIHSDAEERANSTSGKDPVKGVYSAVVPSTIGRRNSYEIGPMSGRSTVRMWFQEHGLDLPSNISDVEDYLLASAKKAGRTLDRHEVFSLLSTLPKA